MPVNQWLLLAVAVGSLAWAIYLKGHSNRVRVTDQHAGEIKEMKEKISDLQVLVAQQGSPLMLQVQTLLTKALHHPDPAHSRSDALLEKLDKKILTNGERIELLELLDARINNPQTPEDEVEGAVALKALMPLVVKEKAIGDAVELAKREKESS